uniref:Centromere protein J C-terminal domain-containing protein n=1 Tax=Clastoptera arizonana TaxID=38151 RepID=A0A1B6DP84_9HEMI
MEKVLATRESNMTIMQQVEELKNWHKQQKDLLQNENVKNGTHTNFVDPQDRQTQLNTQSGLSLDEVPIKPTHLDFSKVTDNGKETNQNNCKQKRRFLRKGEGLARFKMAPRSKMKTTKTIEQIEKQTTNTMTKNKPSAKVNSKSQIKEKINDSQESQLSSAISWKNVLSSMMKADPNYFNPKNSVENCNNQSLSDSFMERVIDGEKSNIKEKEDMEVFEMMEKLALETSFSSSSSTVMRFLGNSVKSTPNKRKLSPILSNGENVCGFYPTTGINNELDESMHVRFIEENSYRSFVDYSEPIERDSKCADNYFGDNKQWDEENCECGTDYSSSDEEVIPVSPPNEKEHLSIVETKNKPEAISSLNQKNEEDREFNKNEEAVKELISNCGKNLQDTSERQNIIALRLKELEDEIEIFRKENAKVRKLKADFEEEYKLFQNDKKLFYLQIEEEKKKNSIWLQEEKQKLSKEKLVFEKYTKNLTKNPNKEERKEIQILKEQLNALKEELSKKESKWGAAQARVRNQVKVLEDDNKKLKQEIESIRKQSQKLNSAKNVRKSNTNLLHTINEQLVKICPRDLSEPSTIENHANERNRGNKKCANYFQVIADSHNRGSSTKNKRSFRNEIEENIQQAIEDMPDIVEVQNISTELVCTHDPNIVVCEKIVEDQNTAVENSGDLEKNKTITEQDGRKEILHDDGRKEVHYPNGNIKKISLNGDVKIIYFNGDVKETTEDGTIKYFYGESRVWDTTYPNGLQILDFPNGQVEHRHLDGLVEIFYPNGCIKRIYPNGSEECKYKDGTVLKVDIDKQKILILPNGQKEIHMKDHKRREYPDGTVKIVYLDGTQETRYSNGRIRLKDKNGILILDTFEN